MTNTVKDQVEKIKAGDKELYLDLVEACYDRCYSYAIQILKSDDLVEEFLEEALSKLWLKRRSFDVDIPFEKQLFDIIEHQAFNFLGNAAFSRSLREKIWKAIELKQASFDIPVLNQEQDSIIKVIHNNILRQQLLHELATTRR